LSLKVRSQAKIPPTFHHVDFNLPNLIKNKNFIYDAKYLQL